MIPTPPIKILIADDELPARGELKYELSTMPNVKIIGECSNGKSVLDFLKTHPNVDLIFLDIEMPVMNGLETAKKISEMDISAKIVFATGYSQFAIQAFDLEAFDYILKPYDEERIRRIIERLQNGLAEREYNRTPGEITVLSQKISLQTIDRVIMINPVQEIIFICTEKSDCSLFYTTKGVITSKITLRDSETLLEPLGFFRTHKGYIVNLSMIQEIQPQDNGTLLLSMDHFPQEKVPVSRHYLKDFRNVMHIK